jgi:integrase
MSQSGVSIRKWKRRLKDGKPIKAHPHMFRDTFAVELLLAGVPMEDVQILLGHTSIRTTERNYAPWVKARQERLEKRVANAWKLDPSLRTQWVHENQ